jgi:endoglucanase
MTASTRRRMFGPGRPRTQVIRAGVLLLALGLLLVVFGPINPTPASAIAPFSGSAVVRVSGNKLVNGKGAAVRLIGVDQAGAESNCVANEGFGVPTPAQTPAMITSLKSWKINAVRFPLNEDCWLGINLPNPKDGGAPYRAAVATYVEDLNAAGVAVIVDLHWGAPGTELAKGKEVMADESHAPSFWKSVAATFKGHQGVLFDLYNEPEYLPFTCLVHGGCTQDGIKVAGFDQLISDVRGTGATNVIMVAGTGYAANPLGFLTDWPTDPKKQLAISVHVYNFNAAKEPGTWATWLRKGVLAKAPIITGELGEKDCTDNFINSYMAWADTNKVSYLAWAFNAGTCNQPFLLNSNGTPNAYGAVYKAHISKLSK